MTSTRAAAGAASGATAVAGAGARAGEGDEAGKPATLTSPKTSVWRKVARYYAPVSGRRISLAYSVDADDAFMFHALRMDRVEAQGLHFQHRRGDTAELNALAAAEG